MGEGRETVPQRRPGVRWLAPRAGRRKLVVADDELMQPSAGPGDKARRPAAPNPGSVRSRATASLPARAHRTVPEGPHAEVGAVTAPATRPEARPRSRRSSRAITTATRHRARNALVAAGDPPGGRRRRRPRPGSVAGIPSALRVSKSSGRRRRRRRGATRALSAPPPDGRAFVKTASRLDGRIAAGGRHVAVDHLHGAPGTRTNYAPTSQAWSAAGTASRTAPS